MTPRVDNHSHILLADISEMAASAQAKGVAELSITEHVSQFKPLRDEVRFGSTHSTGRLFNTIKEYVDEFEKNPRQGSGIKVNRGLEVDYSPRFETNVGTFVSQIDWDILLCSVHEFQNGKDIETNPGTAADVASAHERWREYLRLQQMALESNFVPFHVLSHPVRMSRGRQVEPPEMEQLLLDLAETAKRREKALELNGNDISYSIRLVRMLAKACSIAGCSVSLGSDAHRPNDVFRNMDTAMGLVDEFHLKILPSRANRQ
jgi:HisJ family histidinol phosphate phosphatase